MIIGTKCGDFASELMGSVSAAKEGLRELLSRPVWNKVGTRQKYLVNVVLSCTLNALCLVDFSQYQNSCQSLR